MRRFRPRRPSASMVVALIALFVALGGSSYAAITITGSNVKNGSLTGSDIKSGSLSGKQIKSGSLSGKQIKTRSLSGKQIANGSIGGAQIANDSLGGQQINEATLGKVPAAGNADNANTVGGRTAGSFASPARWIVVQGSAGGAVTLGQSGGFGTVTRLAAGEYSIDAGQSVARTPMTLTLNAVGGAGFDSLVPCGGSANNPGGINCPGVDDQNHLIVITNAINGAQADRTFQLIIG